MTCVSLTKIGIWNFLSTNKLNFQKWNVEHISKFKVLLKQNNDLKSILKKLPGPKPEDHEIVHGKRHYLDLVKDINLI